VFFETNGVPRMVEVEDRQQAAATEGGGAAAGKPSREKADPLALGSVGCPMSGQVIEVVAKPGAPPRQSCSSAAGHAVPWTGITGCDGCLRLQDMTSQTCTAWHAFPELN